MKYVLEMTEWPHISTIVDEQGRVVGNARKEFPDSEVWTVHPVKDGEWGIPNMGYSLSHALIDAGFEGYVEVVSELDNKV